MRFKFTIRQFFGPKKQLLYLHCKMTSCQRKEAPGMTVFSCLTQGQYCPQQQDSEMTMGPFVVLPTGLRRSKKSMKFNTSKFTKRQERIGVEGLITNFRVLVCLCVKTIRSAILFFWKCVSPTISFSCKSTHFLMKSFTRRLVLRQRQTRTQKRAIQIQLLLKQLDGKPKVSIGW